MTQSLSEYEAYCIDEALALRLNQVEAAESADSPRAPELAGGQFLPGPVL